MKGGLAALSRDAVVKEYREIGTLSGTNQLDDFIERLPPVLCRALALNTPDSGVMASPFTGVPGEQIAWLSAGRNKIGVYIGRENPAVISELPLAGHRTCSDARFNLTYIKAATDLLSSLDEEFLGFIGKWTSLIIWTERLPVFSGTLLTSSTFPNLPHCTFLSLKSLQHIPPNNVLGFVSPYALAENLYHEALHQELAALLLHRDVLVRSYHTDTAVKIDVPWRGGAWEPDRVFHAIFVYSHLIPLRKLAINSLTQGPFEREWLLGSIPEAKSALSYLLSQMKSIMSIFQKEHIDFVDSVIDKARNELSD